MSSAPTRPPQKRKPTAKPLGSPDHWPKPAPVRRAVMPEVAQAMYSPTTPFDALTTAQKRLVIYISANDCSVHEAVRRGLASQACVDLWGPKNIVAWARRYTDGEQVERQGPRRPKSAPSTAAADPEAIAQGPRLASDPEADIRTELAQLKLAALRTLRETLVAGEGHPVASSNARWVLTTLLKEVPAAQQGGQTDAEELNNVLQLVLKR